MPQTLTYEERQNVAHRKDSPEAIQAEIDSWAKDDPSYARIVQQFRDEMRCRENRSTKDEPAPMPFFLER